MLHGPCRIGYVNCLALLSLKIVKNKVRQLRVLFITPCLSPEDNSRSYLGNKFVRSKSGLRDGIWERRYHGHVQ